MSSRRSDQGRGRTGHRGPLMPDNQREGALEQFLEDLVDDNDPLLPIAARSTSEAAESGAEFPEVDHRKAVLHSWLAWQQGRIPPPAVRDDAAALRCRASRRRAVCAGRPRWASDRHRPVTRRAAQAFAPPPRVDTKAALPAHAREIRPVENLEDESEAVLQLALPLLQHRRRRRDDDGVDLPAQEQLAGR